MRPEKIFGFLLSDELLRQRPEFKEIVIENPGVTEEERQDFESELCSSIVAVMALRIQHFWRRARLHWTFSGLVVALADNRSMDTSSTPSPEVIERMQKEMELDVSVQPKWMSAF